MKRYSRSIIKEESGAIAIIAALLITAFLGLAAYVVDVGYMYQMRRQLQSAADAAALAGMIEKINNGDPVAEAGTYAAANDLVGAPTHTNILDLGHSDFSNDDYVLVTVSKKADFMFAPILNVNDQLISAQAKAERVYRTDVKNVVPLGAVKRDFTPGQEYIIKDDTGSVALELGGPGADRFRDNLRGDYPIPLSIGQSLDIHGNYNSVTGGNMTGPTSQALEERFVNCPCGCASTCTMTLSDWMNAGKPSNCKRFLILPVVELVTPEHGPIQNVKVVAFAGFFVSYNDGALIRGNFVEYEEPGAYQDSSDSSISIETVRLVKPDY